MKDGGIYNPALQKLADPSGGFSMVALDQRESLREMLKGGGSVASSASIPDDMLSAFKREGTKYLSPYASAILLDRLYGAEAARQPVRDDNCALILAADRLLQPEGEPVSDSELDPQFTAELAHDWGASGLKLLVIWHPDRGEQKRADTVGSFLELCREAELPAIVEGIVRPACGSDWDVEERDAALVEAAKEFGSYGPDLYKAEVPSFGRGELSLVTKISQRITDAVDCPWVVLSSGVRPDDFPDAVAASCAGGASGFLAGRAIWADSVKSDDPRKGLAGEAKRRLDRLVEVVRASEENSNS